MSTQTIPADEINALLKKIRTYEYVGTDRRIRVRHKEDIIEEMAVIFWLAYGNGVQDAVTQLDLKDTTYDLAEAEKVINAKLNDGKDWRERAEEWLDGERGKPIEYTAEKLPDEIWAVETLPKPKMTKSANQEPSDPADGIGRILDTESHRDFNAGSLNKATAGGAKTKTWVTMMDEKVRDTHDYLLGLKIPIGAKFYSYTGASAQYPGGFGDPSEDCNCRCTLKYD